MAKVNVVGVPVDEEVVFIVSLLIFLMLTAQYFIKTDFDTQYTSGVGAFLCSLSIYVFYKLHIIEERLGIVHEKVNMQIVERPAVISAAAPKAKKRR